MKNRTITFDFQKFTLHGFSIILMLCIMFLSQRVYALSGQIGIHDPSSIIKREGVYHVWGTGNQIYHLTSTDLINWSAAPTVFAAGTWPSWINTYVTDFGGFFWAPECIYIGGKYYMYYSCSMGGRPCAIGVATSTDLTNWTDQGVVIYSNNTSTYGSIDPAVFSDASGNYWMTFGSHLTGIWLAQLNTSTGKRLNSNLYNIAGSSSSEHEAPYVIRAGNYYYLFYNRGTCCAGTNSTYYVQMGRATSPTGPYLDKNGVNLLNGGGTTVLSTSGNYIGPGHVGLYSENGYNFLTHHYYDGNNNGAPMLSVANIGWSGNWPFITHDWIASGRYTVTNKNSGLVWDAWGCTGASQQAIAQGTPAGLLCQQWDFSTLGNGLYKINCVLGGLSADVFQCSAENGAKLDLYAYWGGSCQQYRLDRASDGGLVFSSANGNRVVEVPNASTSPGIQLALFDYNGNNCQKWSVSTVSSARILATQNNSINSEALFSKSFIHPNPTTSNEGFKVDLSNERKYKSVQIKIINTEGKVMQELMVNNKTSATIGAGLPAGIYVIQLRNREYFIAKKVIVQ